ncbi:MAG: Ig-like domain-containing protein, partial [Promethearchaeota archaeon]
SKGNPITNALISVHLMDGGTDVSLQSVNLVSGSLLLDSSGEIDLIYSVDPSTTAKNYTLEVRFSGRFDYRSTSYPIPFDLSFMANFTDSVTCFFELQVVDPDDINIYFFVDGFPTQVYYDDFNPPEWYFRGDIINFSVYVTVGLGPVLTGSVSFTDVWTGNPLGTSSISNGWASILADTSVPISWHAGLHQIRAQWSGSSTFNTTYVIINETVSIFANIDKNSIIRDSDSFIVDGTVQDGQLLRGLIVEITLLDSTLSDVTTFYLIGSLAETTNSGGYYPFLNLIDLSCLQGDYFIRIDFNGGINWAGISLSDYMVHTNSSLIPITVIAGTSISGNYDTRVDKQEWYYNDDLYVYGYLTWDNGTAMAFMEVNVTIRDGDGNILATAVGDTNGSGFFNITFKVGAWPPDTEVWCYFFPEDPDNFGPSGIYVQIIEQELFRQP